ncbi:MAG TPA: hypothetical protein VLA60_09730, partial [Nitrospirales bacterium]|nr:hypothetical protein [Nitrospirales bacterium]
MMTPGQQHRLVLSNQVGGTVVADAIKFQAAGSGTPRRATWGLSVPTTGTYNVYARWTADAANATNASYTVYYAGGTTAVPMNQTQNGGQWNLLGTFTLNPASNPMVELSDQANGLVVADAVMVVPSGVSTDHVTYTPTLTTAGKVDIYAKWTENATRAGSDLHRSACGGRDRYSGESTAVQCGVVSVGSLCDVARTESSCGSGRSLGGRDGGGCDTVCEWGHECARDQLC